MAKVFPALSAVQTALLLCISGASLIYAEFLRPGSIVPGVAGSTLLLLGFVRLPAGSLPWIAGACFAAAAICFAAGAFTRVHSVLVWWGAALLAGALIEADLAVGCLVGLPFAVVTGYLINVALRARRNKFESA